MKKIHCFLFLILSISPVFAQQIEVDRISNRLILLDENYFRSVAIQTDQGVLLIDSREPLEKMVEMKNLITQEFSTDTFCYIINTHGCPEHILGNSAFPNTPVIMNENFFNRKKIYKIQKAYADSIEIVCENAPDSANMNESCKNIEQIRNWRKYCIKALQIEPDIVYSEKMSLYFDSLSVQLFLTGLGHGYSTFIYIPEEKFLHVSTLSSKWLITKFTIPQYLDDAEFLPYQINTLKYIISITDSLNYVVPSHGEPYSPATLKQMLSYYSGLYDFAKKSSSAQLEYDTFKKECTLSKLFPDFNLLQDLNDEELQRHSENVEWIWNYFHKCGKRN